MADLEKLVAYQSQALTETDREIERMYYSLFRDSVEVFFFTLFNLFSEQMAAEYERLSRTLICLPKRLAHEALVRLSVILLHNIEIFQIFSNKFRNLRFRFASERAHKECWFERTRCSFFSAPRLSFTAAFPTPAVLLKGVLMVCYSFLE